MEIEEAIYQYMKQDPDLDRMIDGRIYPMIVPKEADLPACAHQVISAQEIQDHDGYSKLTTVRVQFTTHARKYEDAKKISRRIADIFRGFRGVMAGVFVDSGEIYNEFDGFGSVAGIMTTRVDIGIMYRSNQ